MTDLIDQATTLRSLVQQERRRASVIAITSGKGGVGKSNVAVNLAIKLSAAGKRVVLLDADLGLANADVLCNIDLPHNLSAVIARKKQLHEVMVKGPGGFNLVGGASGLARMADLTDGTEGERREQEQHRERNDRHREQQHEVLLRRHAFWQSRSTVLTKRLPESA